MKVPVFLTSRDRWLVWKYDGGRKVPYSTKTKKSTNATSQFSWVSHPDAVAFVKDNPDFDLGFALGGGVCGVDLDSCRNNGVLDSWATRLLREFERLGDDVYFEVSPSETGVKIFILHESTGSAAVKIERKYGEKNTGIEVYSGERYFAVTGVGA